MPASFHGFGPELFAFLKGLKARNEKAWFDAHRDTYEEHVKTPLVALVADLTTAFAKAKIPLKGDAKSLFRLNRDIRFSKDKSPYKTNAGAVMTPGGGKKEPGIIYLHFEPGASFAAIGFWQPEPPTLHALRAAVVNEPKAFAKVAASLDKKNMPLEGEYTVKRLPKGFEDADPKVHTWVKLTSFVASRKLADDEVLDAKLPQRLLAAAKDGLPLLQFGLKALA